MSIDIETIIKLAQADGIYSSYTFLILQNLSNRSFSNLVIEEFENGYLGFIVSYEPETNFTGLSSFTGKVKRTTLEGELLSEMSFQNGEFVPAPSANGRVRMAGQCLTDVVVTTECTPSKTISTTTGLPNEHIQDCVTVTTYYYEYCDIPDPWGGYIIGGLGSGPLGNGSLGGGSTSGGSGTSTGSIGTDPDAGTNIVPITNPTQPKEAAVIEPELDTELLEVWENSQIIDTQLKPCMQSVLSDIKKLTQGSVGQIIQKFSGSTPNWNWEVKDGSLTDENASTNQSYNKLTKKVTVSTTFDASKFKNASDISVARTILHESIHAYLLAIANIDPLTAQKSYPNLMLDYAIKNYGGDVNSIQHAEFARSFIRDTAIALEEYGKGKGYSSIPSSYYQDLAWGGLTHTVDASVNPIETPWFQTLVPNTTDRKRITDNIAIEQSGKDLAGATQSQKGKNAGC